MEVNFPYWCSTHSPAADDVSPEQCISASSSGAAPPPCSKIEVHLVYGGTFVLSLSGAYNHWYLTDVLLSSNSGICLYGYHGLKGTGAIGDNAGDSSLGGLTQW